VEIDDGATYRQAEPEPVCPGLEKGIKQARLITLRNARPQVLYFHPHTVSVFRYANCQLPPVWPLIVHGMHRIQHEIEDDLLKLGSITKHRWQFFGQVQVELDPLSLQLTIKKLDRLLGNLAKVNRIALRFFSDSHVPDSSNDVGGAPGLRNDRRGKGTHFIDVRRLSIQPPQACFTIDEDRRQRLAHFMRNRRGEFTERCNSRRMGKLRLNLLQSSLGIEPIADVDHSDQPNTELRQLR